jgi:hypothetical protein
LSTNYTHFSQLSFDNLFARKGPDQEVQVMDSAGNLTVTSINASTSTLSFATLIASTRVQSPEFDVADTSANFNVKIVATSSPILSASRTVTLNVNNAARNISLAGDLTVSSAAIISGTNTGDITLVTVGSSPSASGASLSGQALTLQPADGTHPGLLTSGAQTIGGAKTFSAAISASNLSGTNSGDVTLAAVGSVPNANGASLSTQALTLQPADGSNPGVITIAAQTIAGVKTFSSGINSDQFSGVGASARTNSTVFTVAGTSTGLGLTGTSQFGIAPVTQYDFSVATAGVNPVFAQVKSTGTTSACALGTTYYAKNPSLGTGDTLTRVIHYRADVPSVGGTGNAIFADNTAFSGNWVINSTSTNASLFSGIVNFSAGLRTLVSTADTSNPPTAAQLTSAFGAPGTVGTGFHAIVNDNNGGTNEYFIWSDGTNWFYTTGTKAA